MRFAPNNPGLARASAPPKLNFGMVLLSISPKIQSGCGNRLSGSLVALLVLATGFPAAHGAAPVFETDVAAILEAHCVKCHGAEKREAGLDVRRRSTLLRGGDSGPALVASEPDKSLLLAKIDAGEMPPPDEPRISPELIATIREWIRGGSPLAGPTEEPLPEESVSRISDQDRDFWAFRPPQKAPVPQVRAGDRVRTSVDAFLLAKLESVGLAFQEDAPREILIRRVYFDLIGLPPPPEEIEAFLADPEPEAYERLVERLLASPHYGERWARHWLDVAGYADSDGYLAADRARPEAWRYRDWVIRAHQFDLPYDEFARRQLAGDEMVDWRAASEFTPEIVDSLVATGFLRTASDPTYPGYIEPNECHQVMSDTIQIVSSSLLGVTLQCARCHAHKFDPFSQKDYYALHSILLAAYDPREWSPSETRGIWMATQAERAASDEFNKKVDERAAFLKAEALALTNRLRAKLAKERLAELKFSLDPASLENLRTALAQEEASRTEDQKKLILEFTPVAVESEANLRKGHPDFAAELDRLQGAIDAENALKKQTPLIRGLADLDDSPRQGAILVRGDHDKLGAPVDPNVPEALSPVGFRFAAPKIPGSSGRRLALAHWLTSRENPVAARVFVNRVWAEHFGRGLVPTVANFGHSGVPPSHPELLDWLAVEFMEHGWSMKWLHRLLLLSTAYRQDSTTDPRLAQADPENILLGGWRPRRHQGEVVRDSLLATAGKLNSEMFGPAVPVRTEADGAIVTDDSPQGNRRSVYLLVRRSQHLTMLDMFDTPVMEVDCPERNESIVPMQALTMFHGPFTENCAQALAQRLLQTCPGNRDQQLQLAYRLLYARAPSDAERGAFGRFLESFAQESLAESWATASEGEREMARDRALAQIALVWLNSNEFLYVH